MKNFKNTLHQRKWWGVESSVLEDKTQIPDQVNRDAGEWRPQRRNQWVCEGLRWR
jgi:hypothetical protein